MKIYPVLVPLFALVASCGGETTPDEICVSLDEATCDRILACYTAEELEQANISSEADCLQLLDTNRQMMHGLTCSQFTAEMNSCADGETYSIANAEGCRDTITALACNDFLQNPTPGDCNRICQAAQ